MQFFRIAIDRQYLEETFQSNRSLLFYPSPMREQVVTDANYLPLALGSLHFFDIARPPGLVEPPLQRTVEAQDHEPAFA
jgi:hypothetical protein